MYIDRSFQAQQECQRGWTPPSLDVAEWWTFGQRGARIGGTLNGELRRLFERCERDLVIRPRLGVGEPDEKRIDVRGNPRVATVSGTQSRRTGSRARNEHNSGLAAQ